MKLSVLYFQNNVNDLRVRQSMQHIISDVTHKRCHKFNIWYKNPIQEYYCNISATTKQRIEKDTDVANVRNRKKER